MEKRKSYLKNSTDCFPIPMGDQSAIFLKRYSSELEFMVPWAQNDIYLKKNNRIKNRITGIGDIKLNKRIVLTENDNQHISTF